MDDGVIPIEEEAGGSVSSPTESDGHDGEEWEHYRGVFHALLVLTGGLLALNALIASARGIDLFTNAGFDLRPFLESESYGFVVFPLFTGVILEVTIYLVLEQTDLDISPRTRGIATGVAIGVPTLSAGIPGIEVYAVAVWTVVIGGAFVYDAWRFHESRFWQLLIGTLGVSIIVMSVWGVLVHLPPWLLRLLP